LEFVLKKYPAQSYSAILGFVVASIKDIYVGLPSGFGMIIGTVFAFIAGFAVVLAVTGAKIIDQD
jgi:putative membrane protein